MAIAATLLLATSCSTTSRLGANDVLYTGVKKIAYHKPDSLKFESDIKDDIFTAVNVKPNNPLYSPYYRTPFPVGLWVYNHWDAESTGFKGWLYKLLVSKPVLIRRVNPDARVEMINTLLHNNGYFTSSASYTLNKKKNPKKASITYDINLNEPYRLGRIYYLTPTNRVDSLVDSLARASYYLRTGARYSLDSLSAVRIDITNALRNRGYYYFRPEYIQYLADSIQDRGTIHLQVVLSGDIPNIARVQYITGDITATVRNDSGEGEPDTINTARCKLVKYQPVHIADGTIPSRIRNRRGRVFRVNTVDRTQAALSNLGIFSNIDIQATPRDTITPDGKGWIDLDINTQLDKPWEVKLEVQGTSKSNSFIGPGLEVGATHKNVFGGGERLSVNLNGSYEWQTGKGGSYKNSDFNSYEFGIEGKLSFPRLLAPSFLYPSRRYTNWTRLSLSADLMNRPSYFKMAQFATAFTWEWHSSKYAMHELTPFKLTYTKLISSTAEFDSAMTANPAIAMSFEDRFVPQLQYTFTYDRDLSPRNHITWTSTVTEAGNLFSGLWALAGQKGTKELFGTPFSQFIKAQTQLVWTHYLGEEACIASRVFLGAAHAYGNSDEVPYREQFYAGGANSVRAFTVRTIGPGSYRPEFRDVYAYYDQTGDFRFEANCEYRFPILGYFKGALFLDAGNVWLLKNDPLREGGQLKMKNFFDQLAVGTGVGLRFDMTMLVVRADLGIALHAPYETTRSGYYNIPRFKDGLAFHLAIGYPF